ncbi:DUF4253 domain-containing protein [Streptomyces sp. NPDC087440]|uniref:DUF4253 domain-containing protein n=1 Tax=Streptomyces sp. NPDC087440 TaxID=3365790 RepID=UPI0038085DFA
MFALPDGLPPGRFQLHEATPVWLSDTRPAPPLPLAPGLVALLCHPYALGGPVEFAHLPLEETLAEAFTAYRRERLPLWTNPDPHPAPEDIEPWPHDPGPPFTTWPGLAPGTPALPAPPPPFPLTDPELADTRLLLTPAPRPSEALARLGWTADVNLPLLCALLHSWEDRFGARLVAVLGSELHLTVERPPLDAESATLLALEHALTGATSVVDDPPTPFPTYAADLPGRTTWSFWWD